MSRNLFGLIGGVLAVVLIIWLLTGGSVNCRESFWDKNKTVIEVKHN